MRMPYIGGRGPDYTTKLNLMYNWSGEEKLEGSRGKTSGPVEREAGEGRRRPRRGRGWGPHPREQCRPRRTRSGRNSRGWSRDGGSQKGHPPGCSGESRQRGHVDTHNNQTLPAPAICRGRSPPATKVAGDYWRLGKTAHLPEVSLFERFLSRARGVRPNRSTRTRRGLARRGGPTYSVAVLFGTFGGAP